MSSIFKLAFAFLREHSGRAVLTSLATILSAALVVCCAGGYDALLRTFDMFSKNALGQYPLSVAPIDTRNDACVPEEAISALRGDPAVSAVVPMWVQRVDVRAKDEPGQPKADASKRPSSGRPLRQARETPYGDGPSVGPRGSRRGFHPPWYVLLGTRSKDAPFKMLEGRWITDAKSNGSELEAVLSTGAAEHLRVKTGGKVQAGSGERTLDLTVVGIVDAPSIAGTRGPGTESTVLTPAMGEVFVSTGLAERITGESARATLAAVSVKPDTDITPFRFGWAHKLSRFSTPVQFQEAHDIEEALDESEAAEQVRRLAFGATAISFLLALLVIFSTLNMGVSERSRQFAVLRAVALTRSGVGLLIVLESLLFATIGFLGGLACGKLMLLVLGRMFARLLHHGTALGFYSVVLAAVTVYGGALLASVVPAWRAMRVRPVDAMAPRAGVAEASHRLTLVVALVGLLLISVNPLLTFVFPPTAESGIGSTVGIGFPCMVVGIILVAPVVVRFVDRLIGPLLARLLGIEPKLLSGQITCNLWRTVAAAVSLTVGLGLTIGVQVWGYTMRDAFVPGAWAPDAMIAFQPNGIAPEKAELVAKLPGIDPERCLPMVTEQPRLLKDLTDSGERATVIRQDNVIMLGLDPRRALGGDRPLLDMEWVAGSAEEAVCMMEEGRACVVPDHFLRETGLAVGDEFGLVPPKNPKHPVRYKVAGAVRLMGWHWQTKHTGLRKRTYRTAAMVFADYPSVAADFGLTRASHIWLSYAEGGADPEKLAEDVRGIYSGILGTEVTDAPNAEGKPYVSVITIANIRRMIIGIASRALWMLQLILVVAGIACIGVLNMLLASVQARRWDMGVLRSLGFTRGALVRAIIAEGMLIGIVALFLSLGFGVMGGWCGAGLAQYFSFFGGMHPPLAIPVFPLLFSLVVVLLLCALAAVWPAVQIGRTRPLTLLQQGRGAF